MKIETLNGLIESEADWTCQACKSKPGSSKRRSVIITALDSSISSENQSANLNNPQSTDSNVLSNSSKLLEDVSRLKSTVASFETSIKLFSTNFEDLKNKLKNLESTILRVAELETKTKRLSETVDKLENQVNMLEQKSHATDLVFCGIPVFETDDYQLTDLVVDFVNGMAPRKISGQIIKSARRIIPNHSARSSTKGFHRPNKIVVSFYTQEAKDYVKNSVRAKKKSTKTTTLHNTQINFYVADFLTPYFNKLLYSTNDLARESNFARVWVSNSTILLKRSDTDSPIAIRNYGDLEKLRQH